MASWIPSAHTSLRMRGNLFRRRDEEIETPDTTEIGIRSIRSPGRIGISQQLCERQFVNTASGQIDDPPAGGWNNLAATDIDHHVGRVIGVPVEEQIAWLGFRYVTR